MDQSGHPISGNLPLGRLVENALAQLEQLGYSRSSIRRYRTIWEHLIEFSRQKKLDDEFSEHLATSFVKEYSFEGREVDKPEEAWRRHIVVGMKVLGNFSHTGRIERIRMNTERSSVLPAMKNALQDYEQYCRERTHLRPTTLEQRTRELTIFLDFLRQKDVKTLDQIQAVDLSEFVSSRAHLQPGTVSRAISDLRSFLRFLTLCGITPKDFSLELPKVRVPRDAHIPSVWDTQLIDKLLVAIDRSSVKGKRDYAILLLACRLGLRACDIRMLKLDDINWENSSIQITQSKTGASLSLPLIEEVGQALIDYLRSRRPKTTHREVFLKLQAPFEPFTRNNNLHYIVTYWRRIAGITFRTQQRQGLHSLGHSLATRLLQQGTPFATISEVLGHATLESTRIYAKADVEALRGVALDPEEVCHAQ